MHSQEALKGPESAEWAELIKRFVNYNRGLDADAKYLQTPTAAELGRPEPAAPAKVKGARKGAPGKKKGQGQAPAQVKRILPETSMDPLDLPLLPVINVDSSKAVPGRQDVILFNVAGAHCFNRATTTVSTF